MKKILVICLCLITINVVAQNKPYTRYHKGSTGDDCDTLIWHINYWRGEDKKDILLPHITFTLVPYGNVSWWKMIEIPLVNNRHAKLSFGSNNPSENIESVSIRREDINWDGPVFYHKAKFLGTRTKLPYTRSLRFLLANKELDVIKSVKFHWVQDRCR